MPTHSKKRLKLSPEMNKLKKEIHVQGLKKLSNRDKIHRGSKMLSSIIAGTNNFLN